MDNVHAPRRRQRKTLTIRQAKDIFGPPPTGPPLSGTDPFLCCFVPYSGFVHMLATGGESEFALVYEVLFCTVHILAGGSGFL